MHKPIAPLVLSLALGCSAGPPAPAPTAPPASARADARTPSAADIDAFFIVLRAGKDDVALALLAQTPALAHARDAKNTSAFRVALGRTIGENFLVPQENRPLAAILARKPALDAFEAAAAGDVARVQAELDKDPGYVTRLHETGWRPLHFAAFGGQPRVVELLLARGADVNVRAKNHFDNTPLQVALLTQQVEVARVLVAHGADIDAVQGEGFTALHEAAFSGDLPSAKLLLDAGANRAIAAGEKKKTALDVAVERHHDDVAALLRARVTTTK
jgi:uncharacterized protein